MSNEALVQENIQQALKQPVDLGDSASAGMYTSAQPIPVATPPTTNVHYSISIKDIAQLWQFAEIACRSSYVPREFKGDVNNVFMAIQFGLELGLAPVQAMQNVMEVNGRITLWGDAMFALITSHPECEDIIEELTQTNDGLTAKCSIKRRSRTPTTRFFSEADAKQAGLWGKKVWASYPQRMLQMRARSWACRDAFPDALRGAIAREEAWDIPAPTPTAPVEPPKQSQPVYEPKPEKVKVDDKYQPSMMAYQGAKELTDSVPMQQAPTPEQLQSLKDDLSKCPLSFQEKMEAWIVAPQPDGLGLKSIDEISNGRFNTIRLRVTRELNDRALDVKENIIKLTAQAKNIPVEFLVGYLENEISEGHLEIVLSHVEKIADISPEGVQYLLDNIEAIKELHKIHKPINNKQYKELRDALASQGLTEKMVLDYLNSKGFGLSSLAKLPHSALERVIKEIPSLGQLPIED